MADFVIDGISYQSDMIDGKKQIHVMKRLLPAFTALAGVASDLSPQSEGDEPVAPFGTGQIAQVLAPVVREMASLSDADVDFILDACMDVTRRQISNGVGWVKVRQSGMIQDQNDEKFATRLSIAWNVISENFQSMFASFGIDLQGLMSKAGG